MRATLSVDGTTTTMAVSACFQPRPRPITLKVPILADMKVPSAVTLPPVERQVVGMNRAWPSKSRGLRWN